MSGSGVRPPGRDPLWIRAATLPHPGTGWVEVSTQHDVASGLRLYAPIAPAAGGDLDALIHACVMGIVWDESRCRVCGWPLQGRERAGGPEGHCWPDNCSMRPLPEVRADAVPAYSTEIAAAWEVVEHIGGEFDLGTDRRPGRGPFYCRFKGGAAYAEAATVPHAICLAALAAVEGP